MQVIPAKQFFTVGTPGPRYTSMARALQALHAGRHGPHWLAIVLLIACYLDAMAARGGQATKKKFLTFMRSNFRQLCAGLDRREPGLDGAEVFYKFYRSEMAHTFFSRNRKYVIGDDRELRGAYVDEISVVGTPGIRVAINVERLYKDFVALAKRKARQATL
jgi:hypothetical protein